MFPRSRIVCVLLFSAPTYTENNRHVVSRWNLEIHEGFTCFPHGILHKFSCSELTRSLYLSFTEISRRNNVLITFSVPSYLWIEERSNIPTIGISIKQLSSRSGTEYYKENTKFGTTNSSPSRAVLIFACLLLFCLVFLLRHKYLNCVFCRIIRAKLRTTKSNQWT